MSRRRPNALVFALFLLAAAPGCVPIDNSGGEAPAGVSLDYFVLSEPSLFCGGRDAAAMIDDGEDADVWLEGCSDTELARDLIDERLSLLDGGETLLAVSAMLGGCVDTFHVFGVYLDGEVLRVWILKSDTSLGRGNGGICPEDIGEGHALVIVHDAEDATSVDVQITSYNPELPGGPDLSTPEDEWSAE